MLEPVQYCTGSRRYPSELAARNDTRSHQIRLFQRCRHLCKQGSWAAFEVKLNPNQVDKGATSLIRLKRNINTEQWGAPLCLGVVTATGYAYERPDGIMVLPIGTLAP